MLYTFLLTYKNTACVRQVQAESLKEAVDNWVLLLKDVLFGKEKITLNVEELRKEIDDAKLIPLRNLNSVWCAFIRLAGFDAMLNVVATHPTEEPSYALV